MCIKSSIFKFVCLVALMLVSACSSIGHKSIEHTVSKRAILHQNALLESDFKKAYKFLTPNYRRAVSYKGYLATKGSSVKRVSSNIRSVRCDKEVCTVEIDLYYRYQGLMGMHTKNSENPIHRVNEEKWILVNGEWWLYKEIK